MDTLDEDPATQEPDTDTLATEQTEETVTDDTSEDGTAEDAATLGKRLADKDRYIRELEAKRKSEGKSESAPRDLVELEWKLENKDRIALVNDEYEKILVEGYEGEKVSKKIALELAEKRVLKTDHSGTKRSRQDDMSTPSVTNRVTNPKGYADEVDRALGLTQEKKRKLEERHPHLKM